MEGVKNSTIIKFLSSCDFKSKCIKLAILICLMSLGFVSPLFACISTVFCIIYTMFEFSADSILWSVLTTIYASYTLTSLITILMWVYVGVLIVKLILDIVHKKLKLKNWRIITLFSILTVLIILLLLPLCATYKFYSQFNKIVLFFTIILSILYIKDIKIKNFLILFTISVLTLCGVFYILNIFIDDLVKVVIFQAYSKGSLNRFTVFYDDPNFTGSIIICAILAWFIAYKKELINKYLYFAVLCVLGIFEIMTISKACFLVLLLLGSYIVIENVIITIKTKNAKHLLELLFYIGVLLIVCSICWKYMDATYQRFFNPGGGWWTEGEKNTAMSNLTTGRSVLWKDYLLAIFSSWRLFFFGAGAAANLISRGSVHSMPISYLYFYGILNTLLIVAMLIVLVIPHLKHAKPFNFVPLIVLSALFCSIGGISIKYLFVFMIILIPLCCNCEQQKHSSNITDSATTNEKSNNNN